jgi:hypothetical protein
MENQIGTTADLNERLCQPKTWTLRTGAQLIPPPQAGSRVQSRLVSISLCLGIDDHYWLTDN